MTSVAKRQQASVAYPAALSENRPWSIKQRRFVLFILFATCIFFNRLLDEDRNLYASHVATLGLFFVSGLAWTSLRKRGPSSHARTARKFLYSVAIAYILWRIIGSRENEWFFGESAKLALILMAFVAYRILDHDGTIFPFICRLLPPMVAIAIVAALFQRGVAGELFNERLSVESLGSSVALGYMAGTLLAFHLWALVSKPKVLWWYGVLLVLIVGLLFAFARSGVLAAGIILAFYFGAFPAKQFRHKLALGAIILLIAVSSTSLVIEGYSISERFSLQSLSLSGREAIWESWLDILKEGKFLLLGAGLGAFKPVSEATGYFMRDPHNIFLDMLMTFGLIGVAMYLILLVGLWRNIRKDSDRLRRALLLGLFWAYVVTDMFDTHWRQSELLWYTAYMFHLFAIDRNQAVVRTATNLKNSSPASGV